MFDRNLSQEVESVSEQARSTAVALAAIGVEIQAVLTEERHDAGLTSKVLDAHAKRAALAVSSLSGLVGQLTLLARMGAGLGLLALCLAACGGSDDTSTPAPDSCETREAPTTGVQACPADFRGYEHSCGAPVGYPVGEDCVPQPNEKGILEEVGGKAPAWCCK